MKKKIITTDNIVSFGMNLQTLDRMEKTFDSWYRALPADRRAKLENTFGLFSDSLSEAKNSLAALFSEVLVFAADDLCCQR